MERKEKGKKDIITLDHLVLPSLVPPNQDLLIQCSHW